MATKEQSRARRSVRIRDSGQGHRRISQDTVAKALEADATSIGDGIRGGPVSILALRRELLDRLRSTGGRPGLEGSGRRQKIPLSDHEWEDLQRVASLFSDSGIKTTAGQIASVLLHQAIENLKNRLSRKSTPENE